MQTSNVARAGFSRTWSKEQLLGRKWFCANLYVEPFDDHAITSLMMEILFEAPIRLSFRAPFEAPFTADENGSFSDLKLWNNQGTHSTSTLPINLPPSEVTVGMGF